MLLSVLMLTRTPKFISPEIKDFCKKIASSQTPVFLDIQTDTSVELLDCFGNVQKKIEKEGGTVQYGWRIWECPRIMIEAEFHAVWLSPQNHFVDITPTQFDTNKILFLPDKIRKYEGKQINNIKHPLTDDPLVKEFIEVSEKIFQEMNRGELAYTHGKILASNELLALTREKAEIMKKVYLKFTRRNDPCICGSGEKFKKCCGKY